MDVLLAADMNVPGRGNEPLDKKEGQRSIGRERKVGGENCVTNDDYEAATKNGCWGQ